MGICRGSRAEGLEVVQLGFGRQWVLAVVCACLVPTASGALPPFLGDAGSGMDAGDGRSQAMPLDFGAYEGNLTPGDADWYSFPGGSGLGCLDVTAATPHAMRFGLAGAVDQVVAPVHEGVFGLTLAVGPGAIDLAALPDAEPWSAAAVGPYSFAVARGAAWTSGEPVGRDAPASVGLASPAPDACFGAVFRDDDPDIDSWTFDAMALDVVTLSLVVGPGALGTLALLDPEGDVLATIGSGALRQVSLPTTGTYALQATSTRSWDDAAYIVGMTVGPEPTGCRPYCLSG